VNTNNSNINQEEGIDYKKYIFKVISHWYLFVIFIFIAFSIAYYINRYTSPIYKVKSSILIKSDKQLSTGAENLLAGMSIFKNVKNVQNEIGILHSYYLTRKAIEEMDFSISYFTMGRVKTKEIYDKCPFLVNLADTSRNPLKGYPVYITILSDNEYQMEIEDALTKNEEVINISKTYKFGEQVIINDAIDLNIVRRNDIKYNPDAPENNDIQYYFLINDINELTNEYQGKLTVELSEKESTILSLSTQGQVTKKEVNYLNKLGDVYIRAGLEEKNQIAVNTIMFIDSQLDEIVDSLNRAEDILQDFRLNNKIINLSAEGSAIYNKSSDLQNEVALIKIKQKYYIYL
jgi:uncharacterized protein involved in exopolysaccharide biosynthesis